MILVCVNEAVCICICLRFKVNSKFNIRSIRVPVLIGKRNGQVIKTNSSSFFDIYSKYIGYFMRLHSISKLLGFPD